MWRRKTKAHTLHLGYAAGREMHPEIELPLEAWTHRVRELMQKRTGRSDPSEIDTLLASTHCADLYLAIACDLSLSDAWERFLHLYEATLADKAATLSIGLPKRERFVADFLSEIFKSEESEDSFHRTRIGSYDGSASLLTWLLVLLHDKAMRARDRLQSVHVDDTEYVVNQLRQTDHGARLIEKITVAWHSLDSTQQLVLALNFRDGVSPRSMAEILGRSEMQLRSTLRTSLEDLRLTSLEGLEASLPRQIWLDFQLWFEHEIDTLTKNARPQAADPSKLAAARRQLETTP